MTSVFSTAFQAIAIVCEISRPLCLPTTRAFPSNSLLPMSLRQGGSKLRNARNEQQNVDNFHRRWAPRKEWRGRGRSAYAMEVRLTSATLRPPITTIGEGRIVAMPLATYRNEEHLVRPKWPTFRKVGFYTVTCWHT